MEWYTLDDVCDDITVGYVGPTSEYYTDDGIPFLRTQNIGQGKIVRREIKQVTLEFHNKLKKSTLRKGDVVLSRVISDKINYAVIPEDLDGANCANVVIVRPGKKLLPEYFAFYISSADVQERLINHSVGSAQSVVNVQVVKDWKIPLPPLTEQKRITSLLARADRLRQLRRTAHDLSDRILQSVFLEMFGDIARNERGWEKYPISKYINIQGGYSFKSGDFIKAGVKVVKITNVHYGQLTWQDDTESLPVEYLNKYSAFSLKTGDIVMSLTRPIIKSLNSVKVCRVQESDLPCLLNQRVGRLIIKNTQKIVPEFLLHFCYSQHFKAKVDDFLSESLQPNISINQVGEIEIPVPPLSKQEEFASVVRRVESLRRRMGESERQVEGLFESLLSESFHEKT